MKIIFHFIICVFCFISLSPSSSAQGVADTTKLLADNAINSDVLFLAKPSNVLYPSSLEKHRDQSLDYVQKVSEKKRDYLVKNYNRGKKYFPKVTAILKRYNLPDELKVLLAIESEFNGNAVSKAGAVGYWQMMNAVAKEYGLQTADAKGALAANLKQKDDRKNLSKSTSAAAKYLRDRCENFDNDLLLAVASYNCGMGNVWKAIKKSGIENPGFWDIKKHLPAETRNYVMNFIALSVIFLNYENFLKKELVFTDEYFTNLRSDNVSLPQIVID